MKTNDRFVKGYIYKEPVFTLQNTHSRYWDVYLLNT